MNTEPIDLTKLPEPPPLYGRGANEEYARLLPWMQAAQAANERLLVLLRQAIEFVNQERENVDFWPDWAHEAVTELKALNPTQDA